MTNNQELTLIWRQLTNSYQLINSTNNTAEKHRLTSISNMLRTEYRQLTSRNL
jgi:hypothetical protein